MIKSYFSFINILSFDNFPIFSGLSRLNLFVDKERFLYLSFSIFLNVIRVFYDHIT